MAFRRRPPAGVAVACPDCPGPVVAADPQHLRIADRGPDRPRHDRGRRTDRLPRNRRHRRSRRRRPRSSCSPSVTIAGRQPKPQTAPPAQLGIAGAAPPTVHADAGRAQGHERRGGPTAAARHRSSRQSQKTRFNRQRLQRRSSRRSKQPSRRRPNHLLRRQCQLRLHPHRRQSHSLSRPCRRLRHRHRRSPPAIFPSPRRRRRHRRQSRNHPSHSRRRCPSTPRHRHSRSSFPHRFRRRRNNARPPTRRHRPRPRAL